MGIERPADPEVVKNLHVKLTGGSTTLPQKYRVLFSLRNIQGSDAHKAMLEGLKDPSSLFRHEVAYCLGQRQDPAAVNTLINILADPKEHPMVRHEAGEALGAIGTPECLDPLRQHENDACLEVAQTCQLALQRMAFFTEATAAAENTSDEPPRYLSVDPTPPASADTSTADLRSCLLDENARIFDRYRAMFALRNRGGDDAVEALTAALHTSNSALLKHEVAYVLGQMQDALAVDTLSDVLGNASENAMVRHEAAEALGSIASDECLNLLKQYATDEEPIVADSCIVALDMLEFERSGEFQYADTGVTA